MDWHGMLVFIHLMLLVFWLGTDVGVFVLGKFAQNPAYSAEQRLLCIKVALILDMFPRVCMVLIVPTGVQLADNLGLIAAPGWFAPGIWLASLGWLAIVLIGLAKHDQPIARTTRKLERLIQIALLAGFSGAAVLSFAAGAPIGSHWLAGKVLMIALVAAFMIPLERQFLPVVEGFQRMASEGSSGEIDAIILSGMDKVYVWVIGMYAAILVASFLGVVKPF